MDPEIIYVNIMSMSNMKIKLFLNLERSLILIFLGFVLSDYVYVLETLYLAAYWSQDV